MKRLCLAAASVLGLSLWLCACAPSEFMSASPSTANYQSDTAHGSGGGNGGGSGGGMGY